MPVEKRMGELRSLPFVTAYGEYVGRRRPNGRFKVTCLSCSKMGGNMKVVLLLPLPLSTEKGRSLAVTYLASQEDEQKMSLDP